jgi:uncharacterized membrane protein
MLKRLWARVTTINLSLAAAALFAAAILHILVTLATPALTPSSGYKRLAHDLPLNVMTVLPDITPATQVLPYMAPDARYAVCRFDTADGSVSLTGVLPEPGWMVALYSPSGDNFFTSAAAPGRRTDVSLLIVPGDDTWRAAGEVAPAAVLTGESTLTIPANRGLAVFRAPERGEAYRPRQMAELKRARCQYRAAGRR